MYKCPGCGAALRFDPKSQSMVCTHCNQTLSPKDERLTYINQASGSDSVLPNPDGNPSFQSVVFICPNCGGTLLSTDETAATFCSYCGSSVVLEGKLEEMEAPDVIIPFQLDKEDCKTAYKKLLRKALFAPNYMKKDAEIDKFRGIYMPYWIYGFYADGPTQGEGKTSHREGDYIVTDHYRVERSIQGGYEGINYDAASGFSDVMSNAIAPFHAAGAEEFRPSYMSGFYADTSDVPDQVYEEDAETVARDYFADQTVSDAAYMSHGVTSLSVRDSIPMMSGQRFKGYFPVWFLANRIQGRKEVSYAVVNGETGRIAADLPIAFWKYVIGSLILAVPIFLLLNMVFTLSPASALVGTIIASAVSFFALNAQINRAYSTANQTGDRGLMFAKQERERLNPEKNPEKARSEARENQINADKKQSKKNSGSVVIIIIALGLLMAGYALMERMDSESITGLMVVGGAVFIVNLIIYSIVMSIKKRSASQYIAKAPIRKKSTYLWKPLLGIAASVIVLIIGPISDVPYYVVAAISLILVIWCAFETVSLHNKGTFRPLPQFNKRGGTGNE
ncbi:MAG: hypothetical protein J5794_07390 [Lachnospiraceae bacterium]|nr:hypothetical protein [Lachnospiraceae bacterium]